MKKLLLIAVVVTSCSQPSIPKVQVEYKDGGIENVSNPNDVYVNKGDSVLIETFISNKSHYSSTIIYGRYKGIIPATQIDSLFMTYYKAAVVVRKLGRYNN